MRTVSTLQVYIIYRLSVSLSASLASISVS